ncbi:hypothetical protein [Salibacter halophilus]|uniref:Uncharacterized protein n=1 Tax=Salibacter halophilus TaxID=1803916 RepID=A0A6N6MAL2_9FLAO|nr:hypothetical protein [Salibacter halophilus]KAB1065290.1 hypothetical protein F3059_04870 [Salibacter halophilus]
MKKVILLIILVIIYSSFKNKNNVPKGPWIIVSGTNMAGLIWDFKNGYLKAKKIGGGPTNEFGYDINEKNEFYIEFQNEKRQLIGKIISYSVDSITIMRSDSELVKMVPLVEPATSLSKDYLLETLISTGWKISTNGEDYRMDFGKNHQYGLRSEPYQAVSHGFIKWPTSDLEMWSIEKYENHFILIHTIHQTEMTINLIKSANENEIHTDSYWYGHKKDLTYKRIASISGTKKQEMKDILTSKKWFLKDFDTTFANAFILPEYVNDISDSIISIYDLQKLELSYVFKPDGQFLKYVNGQLKENKTWSLSNDGIYIWLDDQPTIEYLKIEHIENDELIVNRVEDVMLIGEWRAQSYQIRQVLK